MPWTSRNSLETYIHNVSETGTLLLYLQWGWPLCSFFGHNAKAKHAVYVPSGLFVQANKCVDEACVGCCESLEVWYEAGHRDWMIARWKSSNRQHYLFSILVVLKNNMMHAMYFNGM